MSTPELPIYITAEQRDNRHVASRLAAEAFRTAGYDLTPDHQDPISLAIARGLIKVTKQPAIESYEVSRHEL